MLQIQIYFASNQKLPSILPPIPPHSSTNFFSHTYIYLFRVELQNYRMQKIPLPLSSLPTVQFPNFLPFSLLHHAAPQTGNGYSSKQSGSKKRLYGTWEHRRGLRSGSAHFIIPRPLGSVCVTHTAARKACGGRGKGQ